MKTNEELLDFYGIKLNQIYKTNDGNDIFFKVITEGEPENLKTIVSNSYENLIENECDIYNRLYFLDKLEYEKYNPILNDGERAYLKSVIMPFKNRVIEIAKIRLISRIWDYISIKVKSLRGNDVEFIELPIFKVNSMYKGMEENKAYTLEELDL